MKKMLTLFLMCFSVFAASLVHAALSPVGYWTTIDDVTGKPQSIMHIFEKGNALYGQLVKTYPRQGRDENEVCSACKGARHNQRILGMVIMENLRQSKNNPAEWSGGTILDPMSGKTYKCFITVINNGRNLNVRGYIGFSLFGRTQTWVRAQG
jgi:uncharacterized protein (DUF2147 family)